MTLLGKIFTGLIAVLSILFFAFAVGINSSHRDYQALVKDPTTGLEKKLKDAEGKNSQLAQQLEAVKTELAVEQTARRSALASLQSQLEQKEAELSTQEAELTKQLSALTDAVATERITQQELAARSAENDKLREQIVQAREDRNKQYNLLVEKIIELNNYQGKLQALDESRKRLASDFTSAKEKLDALDIKPNAVLAPPPVNGQVLDVRGNLVEVSIGKDDGLREGYTLEVHRDGQYLGRLKVIKAPSTDGNKAVAEILTAYQRGYIKVGDRVDSKLN
jgi:hypothetical protein